MITSGSTVRQASMMLGVGAFPSFVVMTTFPFFAVRKILFLLAGCCEAFRTHRAGTVSDREGKWSGLLGLLGEIRFTVVSG
jgi:hypothetical protein